jgi:UDP-glucose 4-epimerase
MRLVVFGGAGFLGSHVADALSEAGHQVVVFDTKPSPYLRPDQEGIVGDILNADQAGAAVKGCDAVYNFAGIADIEEANARPLDTVRINVLGNCILLEAAVQEKIRRFVFASSLYVYSEAGAFYRSSKQACELLIDNYQQAYGLPYTILRYGSLYGDRADDRNWVYRVLKQAVKEGRIVRYGDGEEIREYIHVRDAARYSVTVLAAEYENQHVIISGHQTIKIKDLLTMIKEMMGSRLAIEYRSVKDSRSAIESKLHYEVTPYSFKPKIAHKLVGHDYLDLGQGLLSLLDEMYRNHHQYTADAGVLFAKGNRPDPH